MHSRVTPPSHTPAGLGSPFQPHHLFLWRESKADSTRQQYHRRWAKAGAAVPYGTRAESFHSFSSCTSAKLSINAGFVAQEDVRGARWCVPSTQHCAVLCSSLCCMRGPEHALLSCGSSLLHRAWPPLSVWKEVQSFSHVLIFWATPPQT